jgi:hypothetical protein
MDHRSIALRIALALGCVGGLGAFGGPAQAGDPAADAALKEASAKIDALVKDVQVHLSGGVGADVLIGDISLAAKAAAEMSDAKLKGRCIDLIGTLMKGTSADDVERAAMKAFGQLGDSSAGRYIAPLIFQPAFKDNPPLLNDAIECAAKIKSDDTVEPLIRIVEKSDVLPLAVSAMRALSNFGSSKRMRERILDELLSTVERDRPGRTGRMNPFGRVNVKTGEDAKNRYEALVGEMVTACNKLTGQNVASAEDWWALRKQHKGALGELFPPA